MNRRMRHFHKFTTHGSSRLLEGAGPEPAVPGPDGRARGPRIQDHGSPARGQNLLDGDDQREPVELEQEVPVSAANGRVRQTSRVSNLWVYPF